LGVGIGFLVTLDSVHSHSRPKIAGFGFPFSDVLCWFHFSRGYCMSASAMRSKNHLKPQKSNSLMQEKLSIFDVESDWLKDQVYVHGLREEIREILVHLGGPSKACHLLGVSYVALKEWPHGRKPISLEKLNTLIGFCDAPFQKNIESKIDSKEILLSCRYSPHKIKFPKVLSSDLAYLLGIYLGDGTFAGDSSNKKGNWVIGAFFDNREHQVLCDLIILKIFGIKAKQYDSKENCFESYFGSKVLHWFFRSYFGVCNGYKCNRIFGSDLILKSDKKIISSFLQGLFDSDGTITNRNVVKYASTSKVMVEQVRAVLTEFGIDSGFSKWLKAEKYLPLYTAEARSKNNVLKFAERINFRHPGKHARLLGVEIKSNKIAINSPVV